MGLSKKLDTVQKLIIQKHRESFGESPSPMKLQKLCYYAKGYVLAEKQKSIFDENIEAWQHGPVVPDLYREHSSFGWRPINTEINENTQNLIVENEEITEVVNQVVEAYGRYDGAALSTMTHQEDPWIKARKNIPIDAGSNEVISDKSMEDFFRKKLDEQAE